MNPSPPANRRHRVVSRAVLCQTCGTELRPRARKCSRCLRPAPQSLIPGYPLRGLGLATVIAIGVASVASLLFAFWPVAGAALARKAARTEDADLLDTTALVEGLLGVSTLFIMITTAVLLIVWLYRARQNLDKLGTAEGAMGPGWAIGGWFIPFANLVIPFRVMAAVARGSLPRSGRLTALLWGWWLTYLAATSLEQVMSTIDTAAYDKLPYPVVNASNFADYVAYHEDQLLRLLPSGLLYVIAGVFLIMLVLRVSRGQEERLSAVPAEPIMPGMAVSGPPTA